MAALLLLVTLMEGLLLSVKKMAPQLGFPVLERKIPVQPVLVKLMEGWPALERKIAAQ